ncbi:glycoside hydrolase family 2 protein [Paenibacillus senegalimassiliensis]|uniref:glycoside hydrolase family 2 protein n=1 Tax=Paenibacillus senegalimassiliensis TaxID=1737426 RepID=UPI00073F34E4|nr:glycoside hydrolase family 2 [Paenibacillus senegalimassiliensis]
MTTEVYIKDYPRPQFVRKAWVDLNGQWDFKFDDGNKGELEKWQDNFSGDMKITVPYTYETPASGIGQQDHHSNVWYNRSFEVPEDLQGKRLILNFQAVDYVAKIWVNGVYVGSHQGAYTAFSFDITPYVTAGADNRLTVKAEDSMDATQPRGKQRWVEQNFECFYVQTTGIWQSVWMEVVDPVHLGSVKVTPDIDHASVKFQFQVNGPLNDQEVRLETIIRLKGRQVKKTSLVIDRAWLDMDVDLIHEANGPWKLSLWAPGSPNLYDVEFNVYQGEERVDQVHSYFGMRKISIEKGRILLNNRPLYQRLVLDQGYWPDTHLTPPSEEALIKDIDLTMEMGYNGVRKHMKVEDARFLYWCDVKGLLVWSEMGATYEFNDTAMQKFSTEWMEVVRQQYNHPSIITWVPFNESWGVPQIFKNKNQQKFTEFIYHMTKAFDPNRPVITNDGWEHTVSDILTLHDYIGTGEEFTKQYKNKEVIVNNERTFNHHKYAFADGYSYKGQPVLISEFGGIAFTSDAGWGYGKQEASEEAFLERFRGLHEAIKDLDYIVGYCYTQITDVQQETNGLLTEDRQPKVSLEAIREINLK